MRQKLRVSGKLKTIVKPSNTINSLFNSNKSDVYNAACYAALLGDAETTFPWLNSAIELGWTNRAHLTSDSDFNSLHTDPRWGQALKRLDEKLAIIEKDYDKPLQAKLLQIFFKDQKGRRQFCRAGATRSVHPSIN